MRISDWSSDVCSSDLKHVSTLVRAIFNIGVIFKYADSLQAIRQPQLHAHIGYAVALDPRPRACEIHHLVAGVAHIGIERSEARRVGTECVSTCRFGWSTYYSKKKKKNRNIKHT